MDLSDPPLIAPAPAGSEATRLLLGLIGSGIQRSLTPALHEAEARAQGLHLHYQLIDLDRAPGGAGDLPLLLRAARTMGFAGLNITYPCKQTVIPLLDRLSPEAAEIGAVNTVVFEGAEAVGHNTDASGWAWGFQRTLPQADLRCVVLLGAGGAGSAIGHAALRLGVGELRIVDPQPGRARQLAAELRDRHAGARTAPFDDATAALHGASGLIHATPTGMDKLPGLPIPAAVLHPGLWVSEIVYFPLHTELLRAARAAGCAVCDGGAMAVGQALGAFELFARRPADAGRMRHHFLGLIGEGANR